MAKMIAVARCYVNDKLYEPGQEFEYDGPEGSAFHQVSGKPKGKLDVNAALSELMKTKMGEAKKAEETKK